MIKKDSVGLLATMLVIVCGGLSLTTANASYPILKLDIGRGHAPAEIQEGFTAFAVSDSGTVVDGIKVEAGTTEAGETIQQRWRWGPTGIPYEQLYRDFWFTVNGGLRITLSGLNPNETYEITLYSWDQQSAEDHVTDWLANGQFCLTTSFTGGTNVDAEDSYAFSGNATADGTGKIVLEATPNPLTSYPGPPGQYFCFLNAVVVSSLTPLTTARHPVPANGGTVTSTSVELQWQPGMLSSSSDVYFGEDYDDVDTATTEDTDIFCGSTTDSFFLVGSPGNPYPTGLSEGRTYYWRIDAANDLHPDKLWKGEVWSFTVPSKKAFYPYPVDGALFADPNVTLQWTAGADAIEHHVYFGDNLEDVQAGTGGTDKGTFEEPNYPMPSLLKLNKTYYWRIDEIDATTTYAGDVWSFTTSRPRMGTIAMDFWEDVGGDHQLVNLLNDPRYPDSPTRSEALTELGTVDGVGDGYGAQIYGWLFVPVTGDYTFYFTSAGQGELWLSTDDDPANIVLLASETTWGSYDTFSHKSDPVSLVGGEKYYIMTRWKDFNAWDHCQVAWKGPAIREQEIIPGYYLSPYEPVMAYRPSPGNGATDVRRTPVLRWKAGKFAASHNAYFGTDPNALDLVATKGLGQEKYEILEQLQFRQTYYWRIDESNDLHPDSPWTGNVWSFTVADYDTVDDFEDYNDTEPYTVWNAWRDGYGDPTNGSQAGHDEPGPYCERTIVHSGAQSMPVYYDNSAGLSEVTRTLDSGRDWTREGAKALSLWFIGYAASVGSFVESPPGTYTMTASGTDITGPSDEFHFAYKTLAGPGSIVAKVESLQDTHAWAKAGVMIRETLDADSAYAMSFVTPGNGVVFEYRLGAGQESAQIAGQQTGITAPHWVKLQRDISGTFSILHSVDGTTWESVQNEASQNIQMALNVYVGLALTSHDAALTCEAVFSNVTIEDNVSGDWMSQDIGIQSNDAEPMYVALANDTGAPAVVYQDNPDAPQLNDWTEWNIDLKDFEDKGVDLADVNSITIGLGNRANPQAGGTGIMYFDDIRLHRPRCVPEKLVLSEADLNGDCAVDFADLEIMAGDWLAGEDLVADINADSTVDMKDFAVLAEEWLEQQVWPE